VVNTKVDAISLSELEFQSSVEYVIIFRCEQREKVHLQNDCSMDTLRKFVKVG